MPITKVQEPKRREKRVVAIEDIPEEFVKALQEAYFDAEQATLDHLVEDEVTSRIPGSSIGEQ